MMNDLNIKCILNKFLINSEILTDQDIKYIKNELFKNKNSNLQKKKTVNY